MMGRELRRVPMDFKYPDGWVWYGYLTTLSTCVMEQREAEKEDEDTHYCELCKAAAKVKHVPFKSYGCPDWDKYLEEPLAKLKELLAPPSGEGYQLWETTSEGSPVSPVFGTLDELCEWCEHGATVFGGIKASKQEWKKLLTQYDGFVMYEDNGVVIF